MRQNLSSPSIPGSPIHAHDLKYRHSPWTFCLIFLHIVALTPGKCSFGSTCLQSVIDRVLLSNGSAHFGSESLRHSQHFIANPKRIFCYLMFSSSFCSNFAESKSFLTQQIQKLQVLPVCTAKTSKITAAIARWAVFAIPTHFLTIIWRPQ